jgi:hypothetical protein
MSPLFEKLLDGTFNSLEIEPNVVPYKIGKESFSCMFMLVDGIYPSLSRLVKGFKQPVDPRERKFTEWLAGIFKERH